MPDREKVIKGLNVCFMKKDCDGCPYQKELKAILDKPHGEDDWHCPILDDALALLDNFFGVAGERSDNNDRQ